MGVLAKIRSPRHWVQYKKMKEENCSENTFVTRLGHAATEVWELYTSWVLGYGSIWPATSWLHLFWYNSVWRNLSLMWSSVKLVAIFWTPETAYIQCHSDWVVVNGFSLGSGVTWCPKAEEGNYQVSEVYILGNCNQKCRSGRQLNSNTSVLAGLLSRGLRTDV